MRLLRGFGLFVAIACLVWVGVLWHWQATRRDMSTEDILLYLGALPVTLFVLALASVWAWRGASARLAASPGAATAPAAASVPDAGEAQARQATVQMLTAQAACGAGAALDELIEAAASGNPRPALDESLRDAQGLPVMAARCASLKTDEVERQLASLSVTAAEPPAEALLRAMALLEPLLSATSDSLAAWSDRLAPARRAGTAPAPLPHRVRVLSAWPAGLSDAHRALADGWLAERLRAHTDGVVAADAWLPQPGTACSGPELWLEADRLLATLAHEDHDDIVLLAACHSDLNVTTVARLDEARDLFCAAQPKGVIPGEGAAVLVLAGPAWPPAKPDGPPAPHLHRAAVARRDKAVDAAGRVSADLAGELLRQALAVASVAAAGTAGLASDADQHSARGPEVHAAALEHLPHLDAGEDHRTLCNDHRT